MSTTPTTPQWAIEAAKEYFGHWTGNCEDPAKSSMERMSAIIARHAPPIFPAAQPSDAAKLREQVMDAVLTYIHAAYFNGGVRDPMFDANLITDRILTVLAPHLSQREPGDSELLDWLEANGCILWVTETNGVKTWNTGKGPRMSGKQTSVRAAIKAAQRGEGKP